MSAAATFLFYLAVAGLITHELDAVHRREWRLLYLLRGWPDGSARRAFILLHVPLLAVVLWVAAHPDDGIRFRTMLALDLFMVLHSALHWRLRHDPRYEFHSMSSRLLIFGTAAVAAVHLLLLLLR